MAASYGVHGILREHYAKYELPLVLVTGVSGFVAGHVALALLETKRYRVWGTVRDLKDKAAVGHLSAHPVLEEVFLVEADLLSDAGWEAALEGCAFCVHCASPFPVGGVADGSLTTAAVEGTERVLRFAKKAGVKRCVVTSSVVAISSGRDPADAAPRTFSEADFSNADSCDEYARSKTLAEEKAWALSEELDLEVATVNPSYVVGPLLSPRDCSSAALVKRLLSGDMPAVPRVWVPSVDVRDVAQAHVRAMEAPEAKGQRYLADSGAPLWMTDIAATLRAEYGPKGYGVPKFAAPYLLVALFALWDKGAAAVLSSIGQKTASYDPAKVRALLGTDLVAPEKSYADMAESLIALGVVAAP